MNQDLEPLPKTVGDAKRVTEPLPLGTKTQWGEITAVGFIGGERYYWMVKKQSTVAMMPASVVEAPKAESSTPAEPCEAEPSLKVKGRIPWPSDKKESFHGLRKPRKNWRPPGQSK